MLVLKTVLQYRVKTVLQYRVRLYHSTGGLYHSTVKTVIQYRHKKDKKEKKEYKKEKEEGMEILEQLLKQDDEDYFDRLIDENKDYKNNTVDVL